MLVLTRRVAETISIGEHITIILCRIDGDKVRIGISAPPAVLILRGELGLNPDPEPATLSITDDELSAQVNRAAEDILAAIGAGDERARDLVNLTVNTVAAYLRDPHATLPDAIAAAYGEPAEVVLKWVRR